MMELALAVGAAVSISAMCSLFEAVLYSVPLAHIENLAESGSVPGRIMRRLRQNVDEPIAAILSLNTIANTAGASVAGALAGKVFDDATVGIFSAAFTLAILMFSEVIPKTAGVIYSRGLALVIARPLLGMVYFFSPLIWLTGNVTKLMTRGREDSDVSDEEILVMARLGLKSGALNAGQAQVIENILSLEGKTARDIMTPRTVVYSLNAGLTIREVRETEETFDHSRLPVFDKDGDDVIGMVHRRDVLTAMAQDQWDRRLDEMMRPVDFVADSLSVDRLLRRFQETGQHLVMVIDEYGGLAGLVTLEDVLEEILGTEIVDEFDPAIDMRELAHRRRQMSVSSYERRKPGDHQ
jgi:CBS domain containing-hemolysin-like protein